MSDSVAVLIGHDPIVDAYDEGYEEFQHLTEDEDNGFEFSYFTESDRWANNIAPGLRALAGFADSGTGTYRIERKVAVVDHADVDDVPADGVLMGSAEVYDALVDAYREGAHDAVRGAEWTEPEVEL